MKEKIRSFTDLIAWKEGHELVLMIYKATEAFPHKEQFGLISQMRREAISIASNLAEGFSRGTVNDKVQLYLVAQGSLTELQNQLLVCRDIGYLSREAFKSIAEQTIVVNKLINGLRRIKTAKSS